MVVNLWSITFFKESGDGGGGGEDLRAVFIIICAHKHEVVSQN